MSRTGTDVWKLLSVRITIISVNEGGYTYLTDAF